MQSVLIASVKICRSGDLLEELGIKSVADLKGKRVSTGLPGSGTEVKGLRVLEAYGVTPKDFQQERLDYGDAALALKDGKLDAFLSDAGLPGKPIVDLAATPLPGRYEARPQAGLTRQFP